MSTGDRSGSGPPEQLSHYELGRLLGSGGMGMVYEATDRRDGSRVAVKLLHPQVSVDEAFRERFEREAHVAALLRSPYTVHLLDFGVVDGTYFLAMEFIDGQTVAESIADGPLPADQALPIAISVARALEEAEARGVVHRDIKPENIMLTSDGMMKVADFGIARRMDTPSMTVTGGFVGTMAYGAPEQMGGEVDHRTDTYALGATLYCMLTGRPPYGGTTLDVLQQHRDASLPMAPLEGLPDAVVNPIRRCMEKAPVDRYQSAGELAGALERAREAFARSQAAAPASPPAPVPAPTPEDARPTAALPGVAPLVPDAAAAETVPLTPPGPTEPSPEAVPTPPPAAEEPTVAAPPPPAPAEPTLEATPTPPPAAAEPTVAAPPSPPPAASPEDAPAGTMRLVPDAAEGEAAPTSPVAAQTPAPSPPSGGQISMTLRPRRRRWRLASAIFDLEIRNDGLEPVEVDLSAVDPDGALRFDLPERVTVPAGRTTVIELRAKGQRRRWLGPVLPIAFSADGTPPRGGPPVSASGTFEDAPFGWPILGGGALGVGAVCAVAVGGVFLAMGGGGDDGGNGVAPVVPATETAEVSESATAAATGNATETATETATNTPRPTATRTPTRTPTVPPRNTPGATATSVPVAPSPTSTPTPLPLGIAAGEWFYDFLVVENTCPFGEAVNDSFTVSFTLSEVGAGDGFIAVGEAVDILQLGSGLQVGRFTLTYPFFKWSYPIFAGGASGSAVLQNEFFDAESGTAVLTELFTFPTGAQCTIVGTD